VWERLVKRTHPSPVRETSALLLVGVDWSIKTTCRHSRASTNQIRNRAGYQKLGAKREAPGQWIAAIRLPQCF